MRQIISTKSMSRYEWLLDRRKGLGGSDIGILLGLNKYRSPYQLWLDKTGQLDIDPDDEGSEAAYWGTTLEEVVAKEFEERTGKKVRRRNQVFQHPDYPFLRANIDRDVVGEPAILECKTANQFLAQEWAGDEIPQTYLCQVQHYMNVLNRDYCYVAVLIGGQKFIWKRIDRDQELIDLIQERCIDFWENNVLAGIPPAIDGSDATEAYLKEKYADTEENTVELPSKFDELIKQKKELEATIKQLDTSVKQIKNEIVEELGKENASIGVSPSFIVTWKASDSKRLNRKKVAEKYPQVIQDDEVFDVSQIRTLRMKEIK